MFHFLRCSVLGVSYRRSNPVTYTSFDGCEESADYMIRHDGFALVDHEYSFQLDNETFQCRRYSLQAIMEQTGRYRIYMYLVPCSCAHIHKNLLVVIWTTWKCNCVNVLPSSYQTVIDDVPVCSCTMMTYMCMICTGIQTSVHVRTFVPSQA